MRDRLDAKRYGRRQLSGAASCDGDIDGHLAKGAEGRATATQSNRVGEARGWSKLKLILRGLAGRNGNSGRAAGSWGDGKCGDGRAADGQGLRRAWSIICNCQHCRALTCGNRTEDERRGAVCGRRQ